MNFQSELQEKTKEAEEIICRYLPKEEGFAAHLAEAMNYSVCSGGKRLRPILLGETFRLFSGSGHVQSLLWLRLR